MEQAPAFTATFQNPDALGAFVTFFSDAAAIGWKNLAPHALELIGLLAIIDLSITWSLYRGEFRLNEMIEKIAKYGFLYLIIYALPDINHWILRSFQGAGLVAAGMPNVNETLIEKYANPVELFKQGLKLIGILDKQNNLSGGAEGSILAHLHEISIWSSGGLAECFVCIIAIFIVCYSFWMMSVELMMTVIEFNIFASIAVILLPFGALKFTSFLFQRCVSAVFQFGVKLLVMFFLIGLISSVVDAQIGKGFPKDSFGPMIVVSMIYLTLGYLVSKLPSLISGMISGQPSMSGNGVTGAAVGAMGGAVAGAATAYGATKAIAAASNVDSKGSWGNILTTARALRNDQANPILRQQARDALAGAGKNMGAFAKNAGKAALAANPVGKAVLRGADKMNENIRMGGALKDGSYKSKTDEQIKYGEANNELLQDATDMLKSQGKILGDIHQNVGNNPVMRNLARPKPPQADD